jgi:hypothetical protein
MTNYEYFKQKVDFFLKNQKNAILLSFQESAFGEFVKQYADEHQYTLLVIPDREVFVYMKKQKKAGAVMFWDGQSSDISHYLKMALAYGIPFRVVGQWK